MSEKTKSANTGKRRGMTGNKNWQFWAIIALPLIYIIVFNYIPMSGIIIAFKDYSFRAGIFGSEWVGFKHIVSFLTTPSSTKIIVNTLQLGFYSLLVGFPIPIIFALGLNEIGNARFKKLVQSITFAPYFISVVVLVSLMMQITDPRNGILNAIIGSLGLEQINFFGRADLFDDLYVWSGVWQGMGYSAVIYIAALSGVSPELQEAAVCDGATRIQRIWHVDLPSIMPTIITLLIFACGGIINIGFDKVFLMQTPLNTATSEVISTFVYKVGLESANYSFATAAGLFQSVVSFILLLAANRLAKFISGISLW